MADILTENMQHLEDLDIREFIKVVGRIDQMQATERLDGQTFWVGIDDADRFFTSRRDGNQKYYSERDYPYLAQFNGLRGAHAAIQKKEAAVRKALVAGNTVEASVMYGRQPNIVSYGREGKNFISFLRGANGTADEKAANLRDALQGDQAKARFIVVDSSDGETLDRRGVHETFQFVGVQAVNTDSLKDVDVKKAIRALEKFLEKPSGFNNLTNFDLMTLSLTTVPKDERAEAKAAKEAVIATVKNQHKLAIKRELIDNFVGKLRPNLSADDLSQDEDTGLNGVVLKDADTGDLIQIVDRESMETINHFNQAVRNQISGPIKTVDDSAPLETRGGIAGQMKIRIAALLGNKEMAIPRAARDIFTNNQKPTAAQTIKAVAATLNSQQDFIGLRTKVIAVIEATLDELKSMLEKFNKHRNDADQTYRLKLRNGKSIGLSPQVINRTLVAFAETKRNLTELRDRVKGADSFDQLVAVLYGKTVKELHHSEPITEGLLQTIQLLEKRGDTDEKLFKGPQDAATLLNIYLANVLMTVLIYKAEDARGVRLVKDRTHYTMKKLTPEMSPINFWGYPVWRASTPSVAKLLATKTIASDIAKITKKVPKTWVKYLHMDLSFGGDVKIDWDDHLKTITFLIRQTPTMAIDRISNLIAGAFAYDQSTFDEKVKYLPKLYFYAQQFVPTSPLLTRVRAIQNALLGGDDATVEMSPGQELLGEEDASPQPSPTGSEVTTATSPSSGSQVALKTGTTSSDIAAHASKLNRDKIVKRRRNPNAITPPHSRKRKTDVSA